MAGNVVNGSKTYAANGLNQYTAVAGATLTHDGNGNLAGDGTWSYTYDLDNRLRSASKVGTAVTLKYDAEGRLRGSASAGVATTKMYDGQELVAEYNSAGAVQQRFVHGPGVDEPIVTYAGSGTVNKSWLYADHQGSIAAVANASGTGTDVNKYGPFGEPHTQSGGTRFRYTGQQLLDGTGLYHYKARFYSPGLGRFLQTDPIGSVDNLNLYGYVGNNPANFTDPSGLIAEQATLLAGQYSGQLSSWWAGVQERDRQQFADYVAAGGSRADLETMPWDVLPTAASFAGLQAFGRLFGKEVAVKSVKESLQAVDLPARIRASGMGTAEAGKLFGWGPAGRMEKPLSAFTRESLEAAGWTRGTDASVAQGYREIAKITPGNPSALPRAEQLEALLKLWKLP